MWNLLKVVVSGMAIGIAFLMFGYMGIYYVSGEAVFVQEIALLGEIKTLQSQLFITGISGILIALSIYYIEKSMTKRNVETYRLVLGLIFLTVSALIAMMLNERMNENISDMMIVISAALVCVYAFINGIRTFLYDMNSNKNKKNDENKEEQIQEPEKGN